MLTAIVGVNWGDEGKGRMVDLLSERCDVVVRYQGGNNAGHTVVNDRGRFILNLMPSGILREGTVNVLGPGMVIDLEHLCGEVQRLRDGGISVTPENLKISDRATICMPYHKLLDELEEDRLAGKKFGSTRRGIAPVYADKYMKKTLRMGDLLDLEAHGEHLADIVEWKNLTVEKGYGHAPIQAEDMMAWLREFGLPWKDYICDVSSYLNKAIDQGKDVIFEAQLGPCGTSTTVSSPTPPAPPPSPPTPPSARASRAGSWTRPFGRIRNREKDGRRQLPRKFRFSRRKNSQKREEAVLTRGTTGIHKALKEKGSGPVLFPQVFRMPLDR